MMNYQVSHEFVLLSGSPRPELMTSIIQDIQSAALKQATASLVSECGLCSSEAQHKRRKTEKDSLFITQIYSGTHSDDTARLHLHPRLLLNLHAFEAEGSAAVFLIQAPQP